MKDRASGATGVLISTDGPGDNVLKIKPPLVLSAADAERALAVIDEALTAVETGCRFRATRSSQDQKAAIPRRPGQGGRG